MVGALAESTGRESASIGDFRERFKRLSALSRMQRMLSQLGEDESEGSRRSLNAGAGGTSCRRP